MNTHATPAPERSMPRPHDTLARQAHKRASAKLGWYLHAAIYAAVTTGLAMLASAGGKPWALYPALGWAVGLAAHGVGVFVLQGGNGLHTRMVQAELRRLQQEHRS